MSNPIQFNRAINASRVAADLNPSLATAIGVVAGAIPGGSLLSTFANINEGRPGIIGLLANKAGLSKASNVVGNLANQGKEAVTSLVENTLGPLGTGIGNVLGELGLPGLDQPTAPPGQTNAEDVGGGLLPVPAPTPEVPPSIANTATLTPIPDVPGIDLTRLPLNPPIQFSPFPPTTGIV